MVGDTVADIPSGGEAALLLLGFAGPGRGNAPGRFFRVKGLQDMHEAVAARTLMRDTFRRRMEPQLTTTEQMPDGTRRCPPRLWRRQCTGL